MKVGRLAALATMLSFTAPPNLGYGLDEPKARMWHWKPSPRTPKQIKARKRTKAQGKARRIERLNRK